MVPDMSNTVHLLVPCTGMFLVRFEDCRFVKERCFCLCRLSLVFGAGVTDFLTD
jgi:hypothetical protein